MDETVLKESYHADFERLLLAKGCQGDAEWMRILYAKWQRQVLREEATNENDKVKVETYSLSRQVNMNQIEPKGTYHSDFERLCQAKGRVIQNGRESCMKTGSGKC